MILIAHFFADVFESASGSEKIVKYEFKAAEFVQSTFCDLHDTLWRYRSSHVFQRIAVLKNLSKLTGSTSTGISF